MAMLILQGPLEALVGVVWGIAWGLLMIFLPQGPNPNALLRVVLLLGKSYKIFRCESIFVLELFSFFFNYSLSHVMNRHLQYGLALP